MEMGRSLVCISGTRIWEATADSIQEPPTFPLYPEPQPLGRGRYLLDPGSHRRLPTKFHNIDDGQVIVVHSTGQLEVVDGEPFYFHASQWSHFDGNGRYEDDYGYGADPDAPTKYQGKGRRWSYLPWTKEQESSCNPFTLKLRMNMKKPTEVDMERNREIEHQEVTNDGVGSK